MSTTDRAAVRQTIQAGYGDATQGVFDDRVAGDILNTLRERGWTSLPELAAVILAAGGEVRVSHRDFMRAMDENLTVTVQDDHANGGKILRVHTPRD